MSDARESYVSDARESYVSDARELQIIEESASGAARALSGERSLRFKRHLLHKDDRLVPVRSPHMHPDVELQDREDVRARADGAALRIMYSQVDIYIRFMPEGSFAQLIYEMLEQFRVEALVPDQFPGIRSNLNLRFHRWSQDFIGAGLLENDLGLLLFTVIQVCRSRISGQPIEERVNDHTEATRAGVYQTLGTHLRKLRPSIEDQEVFDQYAAKIAMEVDELSQSVVGESATAKSMPGVLAMLAFDPEKDGDEKGGDSGFNGSVGEIAESDSYAVFTREFDSTLRARDLVPLHSRINARGRLDAAIAEHLPLRAYWSRKVLNLFPEAKDFAWEFEREEGRIDPRMLWRLAAGVGDQRIFRSEVETLAPVAAVTILVDCSGSMKVNIEQVAVLVDCIARALDRVDVDVEILGFTTGAWNGGRARSQWMSGERAHGSPGRLNELNHIVFKDFMTSWRAGRQEIASLLYTPIFREGVDGEALAWAYQRLMANPAKRRLLVLISDGSPMDGATALANGEDYLDAHLVEVASRIEQGQQVKVIGLGIDHDMSTYFTNSRIVEADKITSTETSAELLAFLLSL